MNKKLIKTSEVKEMVSIQSFTLLENLYKEGLFPSPIRLGNRQLLWRVDEVELWMLHCPRIDCNAEHAIHFNVEYRDVELKFISLVEVRRITAMCSPTTIYKMMAEGSFPCRIQVTTRKVAWFEHEVLAWIDQQSKGV